MASGPPLSKNRVRAVIAGRELDIEYHASRSGAATIVFLHEGLGSLELFRDLPADLHAATGFGTLTYSRYGNGRSERLAAPRTPDYMHDEAWRALPQLLERYAIASPILYGHSDGASIALLYASNFPVACVVAEAPHVFVEGVSIAGITSAKDRYERGDLRSRLAKHHPHVDATFYGWNDIWLSPAFRNWNIEDDVAKIDAPVLVLQGDADPYGSAEQAYRIRRRAKGRVDILLLAGCGHAPHRERRAMTAATAGAFILAHAM